MTKIEWTDETWNVVTGCDRTSPGCDNCYALMMAKRLKAMGQAKYQTDGDRRTSGPGFGVTCHPDELARPFQWKRPRMVFMSSMGDLFHPDVPMDFVLNVWTIMANASQHTFQVLTKRSQRMQRIVDSICWEGGHGDEPWDAYVHPGHVFYEDVKTGEEVDWEPTEDDLAGGGEEPLPNVWLGTSIESDRYTWRADHLRATPAAVRFLSLEPLLGPLPSLDLTGIDWVIVGGESTPKARPMHPDWARDIRDRCVDAGIPFYFKQWGEWVPPDQFDFAGWDDVAWNENGSTVDVDGSVSHRSAWPLSDTAEGVWRVGKKRAGRMFDGRVWDQMPGEVR